MKIFGIGFTGYIGRNVAIRLVAEGHSLTGLARSDSSAAALRKQGITPIEGAMADASVIHEAAKDADGAIVLSIGGILKNAIGKGNDYNNCIEAILSAFEGTEKPLMQLGGVGLWLGRPEVNSVLKEDIPFSTPFYDEMLPGFEAIAKSASRGVRGFTLIPGQVYGRGGGHIGPLPRRFDDFRRTGAIHCLYPSSSGGSFTHIDDLASAIIVCLKKSEAGKRYIVVTDNCDTLTVSRHVSHVCGLKGRLAFVDKQTLERLCGYTGPLDFTVTMYAHAGKIRDELGWKPEARGILSELQSLADDKADAGAIYIAKG
ncbi:NAD(P)-binding domain protein [Akanthomyces lecanii RCEF 1005]|uniref:NAD(P)-binding domain protein n=1 Tax=Akanthomyces lecanii RCEF 1005 TaxID=1081108 RepID=A0A162LS81_CORDF|nr:NAD(P)-binding domain protein [Akanthomyces lecanii RCEF 1005]